MSYDFTSPQGRLAAIEALRHEKYNAAMKQHLKDSEVLPGIRQVQTPFGRLYHVEAIGGAFRTLDEAQAALARETGEDI